MKARLVLFALLAWATLCPTPGRSAHTRAEKPPVHEVAEGCSDELELAEKFADFGDWKDAETHFTAAAKVAECRREAFAGIEDARRNQEINLLQIGEIYESQGEWAKAEDVYRAVAADPSTGEETREIVRERLRATLKAQARQKRWPKLKERVTDGAGMAVFFFALVLLIATARSIWKGRQIILIHPFAAPTDELAKVLNIQLRYARVTMQNPALSAAGQVPVPIVENLLIFSDEIEPIEDVEIAGSKIPFASLGKLFGRPRIRVTGGFDGVGPIGNAYSIVKTHDASGDAFIRREVRVSVPNEQRVDLLDFAYDVIVKATSAYVDV